MNEIRAKIWQNEFDGAWSAEINGAVYNSISIEQIHSLLKQAVAEIQKTMDSSTASGSKSNGKVKNGADH